MNQLIILFLITISYCFSGPINLSMEIFSEKYVKGDPNIISNRGNLIPHNEIFDLEELNKIQFQLQKHHREELKKIKYFLLNGELRMASIYMMKIAHSNNKFKPIIYRYLSYIHFIDGNYSMAEAYLNSFELLKYPHFSKICVLNTLNKIVLNQLNKLEEHWLRCKTENYKGLNLSASKWLETLIELKLRPRIGMTQIPFKKVNFSQLSNTELRTLLKMAMYLNQEKLILDELDRFEVEQLKDIEVRELLGQILFRSGLFAKAYEYIEDLKTPNAESMKGNLYILREKYELAYAQFKLALDKKINSVNAMDRLLPLAWILKDWQYGGELSQSTIVPPNKFIEKLTLLAAFHLQAGDLKKSLNVIEKIYEKSKKGEALDVTQMATFLGLMLSNSKMMLKNAEISCHHLDVNNCWLLLQSHHWENLSMLVKKEGEIKHKNIIDELKEKDISNPIEEKIYINQKDIEELDEKDEFEEVVKKTKTEV